MQSSDDLRVAATVDCTGQLCPMPIYRAADDLLPGADIAGAAAFLDYAAMADAQLFV